MQPSGSNGTAPGSFFIERVPVNKQLPTRLQEYREMSLNGWSLAVLLDLSDRSSVIAFGMREVDD